MFKREVRETSWQQIFRDSSEFRFLRKAAIGFLKYIGKENGNKLEQSVFEKLHDPLELAYLKADAIMFHHLTY